MTPAGRARTIILVGALVPAVVLGVLALLGSVVVGPVVLVVVAAVLLAWFARGGEWLVGRTLGGSAPDPVRHARLINLVEGLCFTAGLRPPTLLVVPDPAPNLLVAGRSPDRAVLAVTAGLVEELSRIQLEGVLADGLARIRQGDLAPATVAVATFGLAAGFASGGGDDTSLDEAGAALTRYPPALISALEVMDRTGTAVASARRSSAHLWLADPWPAGAAAGQVVRAPLAERIAALQEL